MENINREHPEYVLKRAMWRKYRALYSGGELMREFGGAIEDGGIEKNRQFTRISREA